MSLLDIDERILDVAKLADIVKCPIVDGKEIPDERNIIELVSQHFQNIKVYKLHKDREDFKVWLEGEHSSLLVSGSFGRSAISLVFKESFVNDIISSHKIPVFIAHK